MRPLLQAQRPAALCRRRWSSLYTDNQLSYPIHGATSKSAWVQRLRAATSDPEALDKAALGLDPIMSTAMLQNLYNEQLSMPSSVTAAYAVSHAEEGEEEQEDSEQAQAQQVDEAQASSSLTESDFPTLQLSLPEPTHSRVKTATFVKSSTKLAECPPVRFPEFAVIGRSNVGKSSLINMLTGSKNLALVSKEPGKTRCINHFLINSSWYLVDLPGFGYARTAKTMRSQFDQFTMDYFKGRPSLAMVFLLIDCSIAPQKVDLEYAQRLADMGTPFCIVFTKADKKKKGAAPNAKNRAAFKRRLLETFELLPPSLTTSSDSGLGKSQLLALIASLRVAYELSH